MARHKARLEVEPGEGSLIAYSSLTRDTWNQNHTDSSYASQMTSAVIHTTAAIEGLHPSKTPWMRTWMVTISFHGSFPHASFFVPSSIFPKNQLLLPTFEFAFVWAKFRLLWRVLFFSQHPCMASLSPPLRTTTSYKPYFFSFIWRNVPPFACEHACPVGTVLF